jgi:hypothetical protein
VEDVTKQMQTHQAMKLIMTTYPGFQELPKGVKQMLLVSESHFFAEGRARAERPEASHVFAVSFPVAIPNRPANGTDVLHAR